MKSAGYAGISETEFWRMTPRFFFNYLDGVNEREQAAWERARMVSFWAVQPLSANVKKSGWKFNQPSDIAQFPWEKKKEFQPVELSAAENARLDQLEKDFFAGKDF